MLKLMRKAVLIAIPSLLCWQPATAAEAPKTALEMRDYAWRNGLREATFGNRPIIESEDIVQLEAPARAEDAARVPLKVKAQIPQTTERYIKTITLLIDGNPVPEVGRFVFTPKSGRADLSLRVRVNDYTAVRAVAETNDGKLYMSQRFVQASGGCSAPLATDLEAALTRLGKIKIRTRDEVTAEPIPTLLSISHPNVTGLRSDKISAAYMPPHYVNGVKISFNGEPVMTAETDIAVSEDPSIGFYFVPDRDGELQIEVSDSQGQIFTAVHSVKMAPPDPNAVTAR